MANTTYADDVAAHLTTNYAAAKKSAGQLFLTNPVVSIKGHWPSRLMTYVTGGAEVNISALDLVLVREQEHPWSAAGWGHVDIQRNATLFVYAHVVDVTDTTVLARLQTIIEEVIRTMNSYNHKMTGYTYHLATGWLNTTNDKASQDSGFPEALARVHVRGTIAGGSA